MALLNADEEVCIEAEENYVKSTYRNRCEIVGSGGTIDLSIPLKGGRDHHQLYKGSLIGYSDDWQHRHYMSILSCYGSAPFFEHYIPYLKPFYEKQYTTLFDYNKELLILLIRLMKLDVKLHFTDTFEKIPTGKIDLRKSFKPGKEMVEVGRWKIVNVPYMRVFDTPESSLNISSLDLLFSEGPGSKVVLEQMVVRH